MLRIPISKKAGKCATMLLIIIVTLAILTMPAPASVIASPAEMKSVGGWQDTITIVIGMGQGISTARASNLAYPF